ncbi:thioester domain-containing protein [Actinoplanes teichomyceticus]|uniref:TQXA domain-containing protein n=1 Tax=Actinoplanes teichomyceticus TaxID=1867 RepID=A0A561VGT5_ACTTI|nr:thioester domain-containing protein [Actinoplanes teichomyceticus]TWG10817.1 TQXA domain-containing protein [Actinoplanes teichomyceticus]GIF12562.1 hypothetical protein Ate01nite_25940 [Actinoplanes teichomyceticus]
MFGKRGRLWARTALAAVAGGALLLGSATPAAADEPVTGVPTTMPGGGVTLLLNEKRMSIGGLSLSIQEQQGVPVYCIDFHTPVATKQKYVEGTWDQSEVKNLNKVQWTLAHGYPNGDAAKLLAAAGVQAGGLTDASRDKLLYFATQTAVWHFSDGITLGGWQAGRSLTDQASYDVIKKVYDYLTTNAVDQPEPTSELAVAPGSATAKAGEKAGPFTVKGPADAIKVTVTGGSAVDVDGNPISATTNGGQFWLTAEQAGKATVKVTAEDSVSFGRVFLYSGGKDKHQKLILGSSVGKTVTAEAEATFTAAPVAPSASSSSSSSASPAPSATTSAPAEATPSESPSAAAPATSASSEDGGELALTGAPTATVIGGGVLLLLVGTGLFLLVRRRRVNFTA